jgi:pyruvate kinase
MGASGLVLAAETAIGAHPVGAVKMIESIIEQYNHWTPETSFKELLS